MQKIKKSIPIKILASITLLFLLFCLFLNLFGVNKEKMIVSAADSTTVTYSFDSSNIYIPISRAYIGGTSSIANRHLDYLLYKVKLVYNSTSGELSVNFADFGMFYMYEHGVFHDSSTLNSLFNYSYGKYLYLADADASSWNSEQITILPGRYWLAFGINDLAPDASSGIYDNSIVRYSVRVDLDSGFNNQISNIIITNDGYQYNIVKYVCSNGATLSLAFYLNTFNVDQLLDYRQYYILDPSTMSDNEVYNSGYDYGYNLGYETGSSVGNRDGYNNGYNAGKTEGYNNGYNAGVDAANTYSFSGLLGAVIDVPVKTFTSLFNFELLGVNLAAFFSGLLTLAVILTIVRVIK